MQIPSDQIRHSPVRQTKVGKLTPAHVHRGSDFGRAMRGSAPELIVALRQAQPPLLATTDRGNNFRVNLDL